jgi:hypothetical protein
MSSTRIPDRRRRKRILTLKNFRNLMFVAIALFVVVSVYSELRPNSEGDYGRLFARGVPAQEIEGKGPQVVTEAPPVDDAIAPDPFSVQAAAREQILLAQAPLPTQTANAQTAVVPERSERARIHIVGGAQGVTVVQTDGLNVPVLGGGFGRR